MIVKETLNFERGGSNPLDSLNIGDSKYRSISKDYDYLGPIIKNVVPPDDEFNFGLLRHKIENIRKISDYIIVNDIREKYNLDVKFSEDEGDQLGFIVAFFNTGNYKYEILRNGPYSAYWLRVWNLKGNEKMSKYNTSYYDDTQSSSLRIFNEKLKRLLKKWH
jgi:hypothetical protein